MGFKVIDEVIKVIFKKTSRERKVRRSSVFDRFGRINGVEQEVQQWNDKRKLENAEKYTRQCKDEERHNELRIRSCKSQQATVYFHSIYL